MPPLICSAKSSKPTISAPASLAASACTPCANTATRVVLPIPFGNTIEPRTNWSDFLASIPKLIEISIDSLNLTFEPSLTRTNASCIGYNLLRSIFARSASILLAMLFALHNNAHTTCAASNCTYCSIHISRRQIRHLCRCNLFSLLTRNCCYFINVRTWRTLCNFCRFF